jgi:hypothetical protein
VDREVNGVSELPRARRGFFFRDKAVEMATFEVTMCIWRQKGLYLKQLLFRCRISKAMANMGRRQTDFLAAETSHLLRDQNRFLRSLRIERMLVLLRGRRNFLSTATGRTRTIHLENLRG